MSIFIYALVHTELVKEIQSFTLPVSMNDYIIYQTKWNTQGEDLQFIIFHWKEPQVFLNMILRMKPSLFDILPKSQRERLKKAVL